MQSQTPWALDCLVSHFLFAGGRPDLDQLFYPARGRMLGLRCVCFLSIRRKGVAMNQALAGERNAVATRKGLETSLPRGDTAGARKYAHSLKGMAATVTDLAARAASAAQAIDLASLAQLTPAMSPEVEAAAQGLRETLGETA